MASLPLWLKAIILGIVEGLTEFLPVSSTGHLMVVGKWLGFDDEVFEVVIQLGALAAVWWLFRHQIWRMIPLGTQGPSGRKLLLNVLVGFLPVFILGIPLHHWVKNHHLETIPGIAMASLLGGVAIILIERFKKSSQVDLLDQITPTLALLVGLGQCLAIWPGVSRSGSTIMTGLVIGLSRPAATEFTFLLAIPTMTGAAFYELWKARHDFNPDSIKLLVIGLVFAYLSAVLVVKWFIQFVRSHTFSGFGWYRIITGGLLLVWVWAKYSQP